MPTELYSEKEKQVALSILKGESLRSCARHNSISEHKCRSIVNNYCSRSDHDLYSSLRWNQWETCTPLFKLRQHAQDFIVGAGRNEHINSRSSIWALPGVPTMTLNALEESEISTIDKLIQCDTRKLVRLRKIGKYGLRKLNTSLAEFGFTIRE